MPTAALIRFPARHRPPASNVEALALAARLEPDPRLRAEWFHHVPIRELHGLTAERALADGQGAALVRVLRAIANGKRG